MKPFMNHPAARINQTVLQIFAGIGFVALVGAGVWLAIAGARYVPTVVNRAGTAAVYLGTLMNPGPGGSQAPAGTASTSISLGNPSPAATTTTLSSPGRSAYKPSKPSAGMETQTIYPINGTTGAPVLTGLPDLAVEIRAVGYLTSAATDSFTPGLTVPAGSRPAVRFTIRNIGTNATGLWRFSALIPTISGFVYQSQPQQSLYPGDSIDYTLGFDQAISGTDKMITITANFDNAVVESNTDNNTISARLTILGS